jgi:hypothetical protein
MMLMKKKPKNLQNDQRLIKMEMTVMREFQCFVMRFKS